MDLGVIKYVDIVVILISVLKLVVYVWLNVLLVIRDICVKYESLFIKVVCLIYINFYWKIMCCLWNN